MWHSVARYYKTLCPNLFDVIITGGGHNGLVAAYLARRTRPLCRLPRIDDGNAQFGEILHIARNEG